MKRRNAIKDLLVASGGAVVLPWWMQGCRSDEKSGDMLAMVVDTIVPGSWSLGVNRYVGRMIADCYEQPVRDNVQKQLKVLEGKGFLSAAKGEKEKMVAALAGSGVKEEKDFFELIKKETITGFTTSQKVMEDNFHYKVAPGHYYGCVSVHT